MKETQDVRMFSLRFLYWYTVLGAGAVGLWVLLSPRTFATAFLMPAQDPFILGVAGCAWLAFGIVAAIGLRSPLPFAPIFLVQLGYKVLWLAGVFLPQSLRGTLPSYAWVLASVFVSYIVLDLVAIPFRRLADH
jgi:hypothetical protein